MGPRRVVSAETALEYIVEDIVTGDTKELQTVRLLAYADTSLVVESEVKEASEMSKHEGEHKIASTLDIGEDPLRRVEYTVNVTWTGLDEGGRSSRQELDKSGGNYRIPGTAYNNHSYRSPPRHRQNNQAADTGTMAIDYNSLP